MSRRGDPQDIIEGAPPRWLAGVASAAVTLFFVGLALGVVCLFLYLTPGPSARPTTVMLRKGGGLTEIAANLASAKVVSNGPLFMALAQLSGQAKRLKSGEYEFPAHASIAKVIAKIRSGEVVRHKITVAEGLTSQQVVDILAKNDVLTGDAPVPPEGALLPETYEVVRGETRAAVLQRMMDARDHLLAALWAKRKPGLPVHTPEEAVTLASIVEKETALASERPRVAAVYTNRLKIGMKLDADPTVIYGVNKGLPLGRGLRASELAADTPYNTYQHAGLPPTPIGNPGRASLAAVMDPPDTGELYFVADGTGGSAFARTLDEHSRNVAHWREVEKARHAAPAAKH